MSDLPALTGRPVIGNGRQLLGVVRDVYAPVERRGSACVTVQSDLPGDLVRAVPLARASLEDTRLVVPYSQDVVAGAPAVPPDTDELTEDETARVYAHYAVVPDGYPAGPVRLRRQLDTGTDAEVSGASPVP